VLPEYVTRLTDRQARVARLADRDRRIATARLTTIGLAILLAFFAFVPRWISPWWSLPPFVAFLVLVVLHDRTLTARRRAERAAAFYERAAERTGDTWQGKGVGGSAFTDEHHPYASDLDLFGSGSLFELICIAVTPAGRTRLAEWLLHPETDAGEIVTRQRAVAELRDRIDLREEIAILTAEVSGDVERGELERWGTVPSLGAKPWERPVALLLPLAAAATLAFSFASGMWTPFIVIVAVEVAFSRRLEPRIEQLIAAAERTEAPLALLARVLERIERERFESAGLASVHAALERKGEPASAQIERLRRLVSLLDARRNQFFAPFAALLLWTTNLGFLVERWRRESGTDIGRWIEAAGQFEALLSLASFAYEHPSFTVPEIVGDGPLFDARDLGHPLIPTSCRVTNDLRLDTSLRLLVISGSNMSGKSTMLRSAGVAAVLAQTGSVVCASSLRIAPLAVGASIRIHDSLQEGSSRFYAEILRLRRILDMTGNPDGGPGKTSLLFLLDEILHGTNSHDRRIGAEAVVRALVQRGAIGLVSTHDLALAGIAESLAPAAANVHFEDHLEDGQMIFDYRMRPGVVTKTNALALMRAVGIEV
jgi:hypothetical protein